MSEEKKLGVENLWKLVQVAIEAGNVAGKMIVPSDEKWYKRYLGNLIGLGDEVISLFTVNYLKVKPEFKDMDAEERAYLLTKAKEKFDIPQEQVEQVVEECIEIIFSLGDTIKKLVALVDTIKANK